MKVLQKYYKKIYKQTDKLLKKVFDLNVEESMDELHLLKTSIEEKIGKSIEEITSEDLIKYKLSIHYCKYKTMDKILSVLSGALFLSTFCEDDIKVVGK